jgi:hypothetical protein
MRKRSYVLGLAMLGALVCVPVAALASEARPAAGTDAVCQRTVTARVVALDQPFFFNRLGAHQPGGMVYALERDVVATVPSETRLRPGQVALRPGKRPRPLVLRANQGDCLQITFTNLLREQPVWGQPATRWSGIRIVGLSLVRAFDADGQPLEPIQADGSWVGANPPGIVPPGGRITYVYKGDAPGTYLLHSMPGNFGFEQESDTFNLQYPQGQMTAGLFGAVNVQPRGAVWYRSQVSYDTLRQATSGHTPLGQPIIAYDARDAAGVPLLAMLDDNREIIYSDLTAIIAYRPPDNPNAPLGPFPDDPNDPLFRPVPASPERNQPYREITTIYHQAFSMAQAFDCVYAPPIDPATGKRSYRLCKEDYARKVTDYLYDAVGVGEDRYAINYGSGGIGSEILANRFQVGPAGGCTACKYEEFFLSSWPNGDPAQVVTIPTAAAAALNLPVQPLQKVLYPDDPSNVYHSYIRDHVKFRVVHGADNFHHIHHQHTHQWLHTPNAANSHYLDSQAIGPGTSFTLEMVYHGSGNRNEAVGDSIFHCHFYPHFAEGMWALWRVHDVFEVGTELSADGLPLGSVWDGQRLLRPGARALPDGEITRGTPIPAVVPLPSRPMPLMPATVTLSADGMEALTVVQAGDGWNVLGRDMADDPQRPGPNPGFPFFIPGKAGQRAPRPPLDVAWATVQHEGSRVRLERADPGDPGAVPLDGGLPRTLITGSGDPKGPGYVELHTRLDFSKVLQHVAAHELPEDGVATEKIAMRTHAIARHPTCLPDGTCSPSIAGAGSTRQGIDFHLNGLPPVPGAPYADPCGKDDGALFGRDARHPERESPLIRHYRGANLQIDTVLNKEGWHFPQQRIITLWDDVEATLNGERPPQPLFIRANSRECVEYWQTNLAPSEYALDDYQVRTPTDILGQHIHLVKFDVTASDGGANGYNYEDGTFSPDEVRERIRAINAAGGLLGLDGQRRYLEARAHPRFGPGPRGTWLGAMTTVQRWMADPLLGDTGDDRTLRTVFTHDHFGPSTHQQAGLYAGLLIEPEGSLWLDSATGKPMGGADPGTRQPLVVRPDGGPTSWRANILARDKAGKDTSFREFALEFQDIALAYPQNSVAFPDPLAWGEIATDPDNPPNPANLEQSEIVRPLGESPTPPWPQVISSGPTLGTYTVNYRNEPLSARLADRAGYAPPKTWAEPEAQDYAHVFRSMERLRPEQNQQPPWYPPLTGGVQPTDPYTPLLEAYEGDRVQIRLMPGAQELVHHFTVHGLSWLAEPDYVNSGYRNHQVMGISEHFELQFTLPPNPKGQQADYLYLTDAGLMGTQRGNWGILRAYSLDREQSFLRPLPNNPIGRRRQPLAGIEYCSPASRDPANGRYRKYAVLALAAADFVDGVITYTPPAMVKVAYLDAEGNVARIEDVETPIVSAEGLLYVHEADVSFDSTSGKWRLKPGRVFEPLVLRAAAGDCIEVTLTNRFNKRAGAFNFDVPGPDRAGDTLCTLEEYRRLRKNPHNFVAAFQADNRCFGGNKASTWVGLYPQLVAFDPLQSSGYNVGFNPVQTVPAPDTGHGDVTTRTYYWYAGKVEWNDAGDAVWTPVEFGSANLLPADPMHQHSKGLFGALIIEPEGSRWQLDPQTGVSATVTRADGSTFREFVLIVQDDLELFWRNPEARDQWVPLPIVSAEAEAAVNYSSAFLLFRLAPPAPWSVSVGRDQTGTVVQNIYNQTRVDQTRILVDQFIGGDPPTPVFTAHVGTPVRFRMLHPGGIFEGHIFTLHGHGWQERPYVHGVNPHNPGNDPYRAIAQRLGDNELAEWKGQQIGVGPNAHYDFVIEPTRGVPGNGAGGPQKVPGDYLYRSFPSVFFEGGFWGIFRVGPQVPPGEQRDVIAITSATWEAGQVRVTGSNSAILGTERFADGVTIYAGGLDPASNRCRGEVLQGRFAFTGTDGPMRRWRWEGALAGGGVCAQSAGGGAATARIFHPGLPAQTHRR